MKFIPDKSLAAADPIPEMQQQQQCMDLQQKELQMMPQRMHDCFNCNHNQLFEGAGEVGRPVL